MIYGDLKLKELVVWDKSAYPNLFEDMVSNYKQHGDGPFRVVGLRLHSKGAIARNPHRDYSVTVEFPDGDRHEFDGNWFKRMKADECPKACSHENFHYCDAEGTHCNKHCICGCAPCIEDRKNPQPVGTSGGKILPGASMADGTKAGPLDM